LWGAVTGSAIRTIQAEDTIYEISSVAFSPDGKRVFSGSYAWNLQLLTVFIRFSLELKLQQPQLPGLEPGQPVESSQLASKFESY
jgi:hypothetical protein